MKPAKERFGKMGTHVGLVESGCLVLVWLLSSYNDVLLASALK